MHKSLENIKEYLDILDESDLTRAAKELTSAEILEEWDTFSYEEKLKLFIHLEKDTKVDLLSEIPTCDLEKIIEELSTQAVHNLLSSMEPDDLVDIIQAVSPAIRQAVWQNLHEDIKEETEFLLRFDEDDAAGLMTPRYAAVRSNITVGQALAFIRKTIDHLETVYYLYVIDELKKLTGVVPLKEILASEDSVMIGEIMEKKVIFVHEETDQEEVAKIMEDHNLMELPVINRYNKLLGIITIDDVIDVIREEQTEDIYKMGAMGGDTESYLESSLLHLVAKRLPWLLILLITGTITANVVDSFQDVLLAATFIPVFMSVITQTGGNCGTQSSTLMIRGLATGEIHLRDFWKVIRKELVVGTIIGLTTAVIIFLRCYLVPPQITALQALAIAMSLNIVVIFATIFGAIVPLFLHKVGIDPTVAAGPLMSTVIDVCGYTILFQTVKLILNI